MCARSPWMALLAIVIGCSGSEEPGPVSVIADPPSLDFGTVEVGKSSTAVVVLADATSGAFEIEDVKMRPLDQLTFDFEVNTMSVADGESSRLSITYHPVGEGASMVEIVVTPKDATEIVVPVMGAAVEPALLRLGAARVSFGDVAVGSSAMMSTTVENRNPAPGVVTFDSGLNVAICGTPAADTTNFCVTFVGKTLDQDKFGISGNETVGIMVRFIPLDPGIAETADFELSTCAMPSCKVTLDLDGAGAQ